MPAAFPFSMFRRAILPRKMCALVARRLPECVHTQDHATRFWAGSHRGKCSRLTWQTSRKNGLGGGVSDSQSPPHSDNWHAALPDGAANGFRVKPSGGGKLASQPETRGGVQSGRCRFRLCKVLVTHKPDGKSTRHTAQLHATRQRKTPPAVASGAFCAGRSEAI